MALVSPRMTLLIGFALLRGMAAIGGLSLVSQQVVNLWFVHRRGIAAAAASLGLAVGSMVFPQLIDFLDFAVRLAGRLSRTGLARRADHSSHRRPLFRDRPEKFGLTTDAGLRPVSDRSKARALVYAQAGTADGRLLASLRRRLPDQCRRYGASAQSLLDHADGRNRVRSDALNVLAVYCGRSGGGHTRYGDPCWIAMSRAGLVPLAMGLLAATIGLARTRQRHCRQLALRVVPGRRLRVSASHRRRRLRAVFWPRSSRRDPRHIVCIWY